MIKKNILVSLLFGCYFLQAQNYNPPIDPKQFTKETTPMSPDVAMLGRYSMAAPALSNGTPQENIPLFEIKENGVRFPLSLFYTTTGFRLKEEASSIGLGWTLTENTIVRIVKHIADEHLGLMKKFQDFGENMEEEHGHGSFQGGYCNPNWQDQDYSYTGNRLFYKLYDAQPDIYIYNVAGFKGKFFWLNNKAIQLEYNDVKISGETIDNKLVFKLLTPDGIQYQFNEADRTWPTPPPVIRPMMCGGANQIETYADVGNTTCWRLKEIKNLLTQSRITFTYSSNIYEQEKTIYQTTSLTLIAKLEGDGQFHTIDYRKDENGYKTFNEIYYLQEISSENYDVQFITDTRSDAGQNRIKQIRIFNKMDLLNPVKTIIFNQEYFGDATHKETSWLKLKGLTIQGEGNDLQYGFSYVNESSIPANLDRQTMAIDHWGYFNNVSNSTLVPFTPYIQQQLSYNSALSPSIVPWAGRDPDFFYSKLFALETVTYPTGGYSRIQYQSADTKGIRVASVEDNDGQRSIFRYYNYGPGLVTLADYYPDEYYSDQCCVNDPQRTQYAPTSRITTYGSTPTGSVDFFAELNDRFYEDVFEYIGTPDGQGGRTEHKFLQFPGLGWEVLPSETITYKYGSTDFVSKQINNYGGVTLATITYWNLPTLSWTGNPTGPCVVSPSGMDPSCCPQDPDLAYILGQCSAGTNYLSPGWLYLTSTQEIINGVTRTSRFSYRSVESSTGLPKNTEPIEIEEDLSDGRTKQTFLYYPGDVDPDNSSTILGVPQMWDPLNSDFKNYILPVVKSKTFIGTKLVSKNINVYTYNAASGNVVQSASEVSPTGIDAQKIIWDYGYDEKANIISVRNENDIPQSFIWGYNFQYPIAKVTNADPNNIAYTSFETDANGKWTIPSSLRNTQYAVTGTQSYDLSNGNITIPLYTLNPTKTYVISYWSRNGKQNVGAGFPYKTGRTINGWTYYEHLLPVNSTGSVGVSGSGLIDELRLYPSNAQMLTYTYNPLFGMTSSCDINNKIMVYEYDRFGRLRLIKDEEGNILKTFTYKYQEAQQ